MNDDYSREVDAGIARAEEMLRRQRTRRKLAIGLLFVACFLAAFLSFRKPVYNALYPSRTPTLTSTPPPTNTATPTLTPTQTITPTNTPTLPSSTAWDFSFERAQIIPPDTYIVSVSYSVPSTEKITKIFFGLEPLGCKYESYSWVPEELSTFTGISQITIVMDGIPEPCTFDTLRVFAFYYDGNGTDLYSESFPVDKITLKKAQ